MQEQLPGPADTSLVPGQAGLAALELCLELSDCQLQLDSDIAAITSRYNYIIAS